MQCKICGQEYTGEQGYIVSNTDNTPQIRCINGESCWRRKAQALEAELKELRLKVATRNVRLRVARLALNQLVEEETTDSLRGKIRAIAERMKHEQATG